MTQHSERNSGGRECQGGHRLRAASSPALHADGAEARILRSHRECDAINRNDGLPKRRSSESGCDVHRSREVAPRERRILDETISTFALRAPIKRARYSSTRTFEQPVRDAHKSAHPTRVAKIRVAKLGRCPLATRIVHARKTDPPSPKFLITQN